MRSVLMNWIRSCGMTLGLTLAAAGPARGSGQQVPPQETGTPLVTITRDGNRFQMTDAATGFPIMPMGYSVFEDMGPGITSQIDIRPQPSGLDIVYTLTNTGTQPSRIGKLPFGKINLGNNITYQDFRHIGEPISADYNDFVAQAYSYPNDMYSPVWVLRNADYAVSFSLQYPILDYRHDARIMMRSTPADADPDVYGPRGWIVEFRFANFGDETPQGRILREGMLPAGETRTYVVSIRTTKQPTDWIRTLVPYRNYFKSMYGSVTYRRDPRPIRPVLLAVEHNISPGNPHGWAGYPNQRPDQYTFRPWMESIRQDSKWSRVMFWAPTGLYDQHTELNYPFQFTSRWVDEPELGSALDPENGFPSIPAAGMTLGLWWGRAVQVAREWNPSVMENFDPGNRDHREAAFREMDLAVQAGATDVGLDTFHTMVTPIWKLYPWLRTLRERYPTVKFCIEPIACDILHTQAAMFVAGWNSLMPRDGGIEWTWLPNEYYLADFLNPGHESWGAMSYHVHRAYGVSITPTAVQDQTQRLASLGFVPVMFDDVPDPREIRAGDSWMQTVPHDLLPGSGWNVNYDHNLVVRGADGRMQMVSSNVAQRPGTHNDMGHRPATPGAAQPGASPSGDDDDDDDAAEPGGPDDDGMNSAANGEDPTRIIIVRPGNDKPKASRSKGSSNRANKSANRTSSYPRSRAGAGVSAAALARAGLLGKSVTSVSRAQVQQAIDRLGAPGGFR